MSYVALTHQYRGHEKTAIELNPFTMGQFGRTVEMVKSASPQKVAIHVRDNNLESC